MSNFKLVLKILVIFIILVIFGYFVFVFSRIGV